MTHGRVSVLAASLLGGRLLTRWRSPHARTRVRGARVCVWGTRTRTRVHACVYGARVCTRAPYSMSALTFRRSSTALKIAVKSEDCPCHMKGQIHASAPMLPPGADLGVVPACAAPSADARPRVRRRRRRLSRRRGACGAVRVARHGARGAARRVMARVAQRGASWRARRSAWRVACGRWWHVARGRRAPGQSPKARAC